MKIILIAAVSKNNVIGENDRIPWNYPEDLKRFKKLTMGHPIIVGRKTYESIGRTLPGRQNIILTRNEDYKIEGADVCHSLDEAFEKSEGEKVFVIGGQSVYEKSMPVADQLEITRVHKEVDGDVFFPEIDHDKWVETKREDKDEYSFVTYIRKCQIN